MAERYCSGTSDKMKNGTAAVEPGVLYVVATPIGNLGDMTPRALEALSQVDLVAAEDTRRTRRLLSHFGLRCRLLALHEHNEAERSASLLKVLRAGRSVALVSDAGTPVVSDPGTRLVAAAHGAKIRVVPIPGASALLAALSASGLPGDRFVFEGFLPALPEQRRRRIRALQAEQRTLVLFEAPHRILDLLADLRAAFGDGRRAVVARELTKRFETVRTGAFGDLHEWLKQAPEQQRGEFVLLIEGSTAPPEQQDVRGLLTLLLEELPVKRAAALAARITGGRRNTLYALALELTRK
jgi:16S rRNA (cytidine1402-2'-O)-methyltransferase